MSDRVDWLTTCNEQGIPLSDFKRTFCDRCLQPTCTRSIASQSKFEQRVTTWHKRLFEAPAKLDPEDPRIVQIQSKKFVEAPSNMSHNGGAWIDPRDLDVESTTAVVPVGSEPFNTPSVGPQMVGSSINSKSSDPWEVKPKAPTLSVVKSGARIRLGVKNGV